MVSKKPIEWVFPVMLSEDWLCMGFFKATVFLEVSTMREKAGYRRWASVKFWESESGACSCTVFCIIYEDLATLQTI
jgi:hypothetical protein